MGDLITGAVSWSSRVRLGGVQIARDFALQPYRVTYPLPSFSGSAVVPTTVDMFVNGFKTNSESLQPGPWSLNNLPSPCLSVFAGEPVAPLSHSDLPGPGSSGL
ncbi:MAG: hypothetical protein ACMX3H_00455 [Sodalis sp. (in: enterobacteria)]|uniref:hypothetical protein n=1 Tax=Sodalis sp. (in: enterobacteria) TaxID=1898979 RepID=UPI0039E3721B